MNMEFENKFSKTDDNFVFFDLKFWILPAVIFPSACGHVGFYNSLHLFRISQLFIILGK